MEADFGPLRPLLAGIHLSHLTWRLCSVAPSRSREPPEAGGRGPKEQKREDEASTHEQNCIDREGQCELKIPPGSARNVLVVAVRKRGDAGERAWLVHRGLLRSQFGQTLDRIGH